MNRRTKKKEWQKLTTAQQADLMERVTALENLSQSIIAEQNIQRERVSAVADDLIVYKAAQRQRQEREARYRARQERIRWEKEQEKREFHLKLKQGAAIVALAVAVLLFALVLPVPERDELIGTAEPMVVAADPAEGVVEAVAMNWEG